MALAALQGGGAAELMGAGHPENVRGRSQAADPSSAPSWSPKTARTLLTDRQIARARSLCETDAAARALLETILEQADSWTALTEEEIRSLLPGGEVPRAFNVSAQGCPVHGTEIYRHGTYPWRLDRRRPFVVICPVGGEEYPSNDYAAYRASGMTDGSLLTGPYPDDGRGWVAPDGEKYWFVGYACHWNWRTHWLPAVASLSQAYVLTGERRYAQTCVALLDRVAECYPAFDYASQSRYSEMTGGNYHGKILNLIWETSTLGNLATAYDAVFDSLRGPDPIRLPHRAAAEIRANIERNLLDEGIDAVLREQIRGNWGMHQRALAIAATVRQSERSERLIHDVVLEDTAEGKHAIGLGVDYALYNLVFADGMPFETSPGYCFLWASTVAQTAETLRLAGIDLYANPKVRRMFDAPLELICLGRFTPNLGDAGGMGAGWVGPTPDTYRKAFAALREPRYAWALLRLDPSAGEHGYARYEDLFDEFPHDALKSAASRYEHSPRNRLLDDYGLAILNNPADTAAACLTYGMRAGHGHFDRLGIELFAHGLRISPDLGYPDFMNAFVPGIYSWTKNTVSHNTVVVDEGRQSGNAHGRVLRFVDGDRARLLDVSAGGTYPQTSVYRRTLLQIDVDPDGAYLIDVFRVAGGSAHDLSVHGAPGRFRMLGTELGTPRTEGTLAGEDVGYGDLYDDPVLGAPDYRGGYGGYAGSGFQHLFNVRRVPPGQGGIAEWRTDEDEDVRLRVRILPQEAQELIVADAYVSPTRKIPDVVTYLLARRRGEDLQSCFVTIWEPYRRDPWIETVESLDVEERRGGLLDEAGRSVALRIRLTDGREHLLMLAVDEGAMRRAGNELESDGAAAVSERARDETSALLLSGGTTLRRGDTSFAVPRPIRGTVREVHPRQARLLVVPDDASGSWEPLSNAWVRISNEHRSCMRPVRTARQTDAGIELHVGPADLLCGRFVVRGSDAPARTVTGRPSPPWDQDAVGMHVVNESMMPTGRVVSRVGPTLRLAEDCCLEQGFADTNGDGRVEAYLSAAGPGDRVEIVGTFRTQTVR